MRIWQRSPYSFSMNSLIAITPFLSKNNFKKFPNIPKKLSKLFFREIGHDFIQEFLEILYKYCIENSKHCYMVFAKHFCQNSTINCLKVFHWIFWILSLSTFLRILFMTPSGIFQLNLLDIAFLIHLGITTWTPLRIITVILPEIFVSIPIQLKVSRIKDSYFNIQLKA